MLNQQTTAQAKTSFLQSLSDFSARRFSSTEGLIDAVLPLITNQFGLRTSFVTHISPEKNQNYILATHNEPEGCGLPADIELALEDTF